MDLLTTWGFSNAPTHSYVQRWGDLIYEYRDATEDERDACILRVIDTLSSEIVRSGDHRRDDWEKGWDENKELFKKDRNHSDLIPRYFDKINFMRFHNNWILPITPSMELTMLYQLVETFVTKYATENQSIYEFGCGTGHHLQRLRKLFPDSRLTGLDWATSSQELIRETAKTTGDSNLYAENFNFFAPNTAIEIEPNSIALTIAALEQVGANHKPFIDYLIKSEVELVVNFEPIEEVLSEDILLEGISRRYFRKRNYLTSYLSYLRELAEQREIEILCEQRAHFGSFYIEGYTVIIWRPKKTNR